MAHEIPMKAQLKTHESVQLTLAQKSRGAASSKISGPWEWALINFSLFLASTKLIFQQNSK